MQNYLSRRMPGVGSQRARMLVDEFGEGLQDVLRKPTSVALQKLKEVPGLSAKVAADIKAAWDTNKWKSECSLNCESRRGDDLAMALAGGSMVGVAEFQVMIKQGMAILVVWIC